MRRRPSFVIHGVVACLLFAAVAQPATAGGLISTERIAAAPVDLRRADTVAQDAAAAQRSALAAALVQAGVEKGHADARVVALTNSEMADLSARYASAPAGGVWFAPFLLVAMVIGVLIRNNERVSTSTSANASATAEIDTDLFGRPRSMAVSP